MDKRSAQMHAYLLKFLPMIGQPNIKLETQEDGEDCITFNLHPTDAAITCGELISQKTILGAQKLPGYRVFWWKHYPATRWEPEDAEDVTECETLNAETALMAIASLLARDAARQVLESFSPEY